LPPRLLVGCCRGHQPAYEPRRDKHEQYREHVIVSLLGPDTR
jgi:hypothetical protein